MDDGVTVRCRMSSECVWAICAPKSLNPDRRGGNVLGFEMLTEDEWTRWQAAVLARPSEFREGLPRVVDGAYRCEADEAAALARWLASRGTP